MHRTIKEFHGRDEPVDTITVASFLQASGQLAKVKDGPLAIRDLEAATPNPRSAPAYAASVLRALASRAAMHSLEDAKTRILRGEEPASVFDGLRPTVTAADTAPDRRLVHGGTFALDGAAELPALWGTATAPLWSSGESLLIVGPPGVSKSTLAQGLLLSRVGISAPNLLGLEVAISSERALYLAGDRPAQVRRSLRRNGRAG